MPMLRAAWVRALLGSVMLGAPVAIRADRSLLTITPDPPLSAVVQRAGRALFRVDGVSLVSLRVRSALDGAANDLTTSCTFTSASPEIVASPGGALTFSEVAQETLAAVVIECPGAREIVGFLITPSGP
jgi:hypothetical protein